MSLDTSWQRTLVRITTLLALLISWLGGCSSQQDSPRSAPPPHTNAEAPHPAEAARRPADDRSALAETPGPDEAEQRMWPQQQLVQQRVEAVCSAEPPPTHAEAPRPAEAAHRPAEDRPAPAETSCPTARPVTRLTQISIVDRILDSLELANIAFNTPPSINLTASAQIQLLLSLEQSIEDLRKTLTQAGDKEGAQIRVSERMEAHLTGQNFQITDITPEDQAITSKGVTEWKWEVKPKTLGRHSLHLTLTALFVVDGNSTRRAIRTFDKTIEVDVTWPQQISGFVVNNWQWLWAAILFPIAGWVWSRWKNKSRTSGNSNT